MASTVSIKIHIVRSNNIKTMQVHTHTDRHTQTLFFHIL